MRVLLTGGTGFVGRRVVRFILEQQGPQDVCCLVQPPAAESREGRVGRQYLERSGVQLIEGDLDRPEVSRIAAPAFDLLIHIAARTSTRLPEEALRANDLGLGYLLDWVRDRSRGTRVIYTSTIGVMDRDGPCRGQPLNEDSRCIPRTPYAVTKLRGEQVLRDRARADGFDWTILRLPTVYGPGQMAGGLFDRLIALAASGSVLGRLDWPGRTSVIYVDDVARIIWALGRDPVAAGQLVCIASDESLTVAQLASEVGRAMGSPVRPIRLPSACWAAVRQIAWNRPLSRMMSAMPPAVWLPFWRLGLIADDGFWFDTTRLRQLYHAPLTTVPQGLAQMLAETGGRPRVSG